MRIRVEKPFVGQDGRVLEVGEEIEVNDSLASDIVRKGYAREVREKRGPLFAYRIPVSEKRSIALTVWPPLSGSGPSVALEESRKSDGGWEHAKIYLPADRLLEVAEVLREAWRKVRDWKS
jgi:hypothetical protein